MGVAATILFFFLWLQFEKGARARRGLFPASRADLREIFSRSRSDAQAKALKAVFFAGSALLSFAIWEGCLWAVLEKTWGWAWQLLGLSFFLTLLYLRQRDYEDTGRGPHPLRPLQVALMLGGLFLLTGPLVSLLLGIWFAARYAYYWRRFVKAPLGKN